MQQQQNQAQHLQQQQASNNSSALPLGPPVPQLPLMRGASSDMFWNSVDMGDLEPTPLEVSPLEDGLEVNLDGEEGDFDIPVDDFFDLDPFPLENMPLEGEDWVRVVFCQPFFALAWG